MGSFGGKPLKSDQLDILFVGNSHTCLHHMPQMVRILTQAVRPSARIRTGQAVGEGVDLQWHAKNVRTRALIVSRHWDFVVLQERSGGPLEDPASMFTAARCLDRLIRDQGSRTVFFMTWAKRDQPEMQAVIADAYVKISRELNARLAPVGRVWQQASDNLPDLDLYHRDGRHAGARGAYLTACVFTLLFVNAGPVFLPADVVMGNRTKVSLPISTARHLQQIAFDQLATAKSRSARPIGMP